MRPVSDRFLAEVRRSHRVYVEAWLWPAGGTDAVRIPITDGSVTLDATAAVRGRCDIQVEHADWIPNTAGDRLSPFGAEIEIRRGVIYSDGTTESVALGRFGIEGAEVSDDGTGAGVRVEAMDRAERMSKAKFEDVYQVASGTDFTKAILDLAQEAFPAVPYMDGFLAASPISLGRPVTAQPGDDRWEFMQGLATALGMVLYFDGDGVLTLRAYAAKGPVLELVEGEGGVLLSASRSWSRTSAFNRVIVTGESTTSNVYRGVATDLEPSSPTYYYGPFGRCPEFRTYPDIVSDTQAETVAASILAQHIGTASTVSFGMVPNPALEPEDTILISRPSIGVDENHIIDSLTIGLAATEQMSGTTRERLAF